jgi:tRNA pseudouridine38-40 synthase
LKIKLVIAYDGTAYSGWQFQKIGVGVQEIIEKAMTRLFPHAGRLHGSSRTDSGVHALGMVAHFEIPTAEFRMPVRKLALALNAHLPEDIRIMSAQQCRDDFHARFQAVSKQYRYCVWNHRTLNPLLRHVAWHVPAKLDIGAMRAAARRFVGRHDFRSFAANRNYEVEVTVRTLSRCDLRRSGALLTFVIEGEGFLYKMCRGMVGTLVQVGQHKIDPKDIENIFERRDRRLAGMNAPAHGLVLWQVRYAPEDSGNCSARKHVAHRVLQAGASLASIEP